MNPLITDYLSKKYGFQGNLSDDALKAALEQSREAQFMNTLNRAGNTIGAAFAGTKPDYSFNNEMDRMAQAPVAELVTRRKAEAENLGIQNVQINHQQLQSAHDPNSQQSQTLRKAWEKALPGIADAYGDDWKHVSAADGEMILRPLEFREQLDARKQMMRIHQQQQQDKVMSEAVDKIEQSKMRGAVKSAWEAERLVNNAKDILNAYPDLNQMPHQQIALLVDELGKIARGGAATEGSQHALMPNTLTSTFMEGLSKLRNNPQGAQVGEFLKSYGSYLDDLKSNAKTMIGQSINSTLTGYGNRLRPEDLDKIKQNYVDYLSPTSPKAAPTANHRIRVTNGKETFDILPEDLIHAQREGFKIMGTEVARE